MTRRLLVVTDLDATLLDEDYRWQAAAPALAALRDGGHVVVLNSSKTLAEMQALAAELALDGPVVAENGGVIAWPDEDGWRIETPGVPRSALLAHAHALRAAEGYRFEGFADWSDQEVAERTGLSIPAATRARDRHATEPLDWQDTPERQAAFVDALMPHGIRALRGGKFLHLMGSADKADGLRAVRSRYQADDPDVEWTTVALGDSPNDRAMLEAADVAVVVPNPHRTEPLRVDAPRVIRAPEPGPDGWNTAMRSLLDEVTSG